MLLVVEVLVDFVVFAAVTVVFLRFCYHYRSFVVFDVLVLVDVVLLLSHWHVTNHLLYNRSSLVLSISAHPICIFM